MEQVYKRNDLIVKLFACLFIAIFLVFTFIGSRVFGSTISYDITYDGNNYSIVFPNYVEENNYNYFFYMHNYHYNYGGSNHYKTYIIEFFVAKGEIKVEKKFNSTYGDYYTFTCEQGISKAYLSRNQNYYEYNRVKEAIENFANSSEPSNFSTSVDTAQYFDNEITEKLYFTNSDIKNSNDDVVFQAPPQEKDKVLAPIVEGEEMKPLQEILQILPIVMIVIVGYLALRKGLATLFRFLRTS